MRRTVSAWVLALVLLLCASAANAGEFIAVKCKDKACAYKSQLKLGGSYAFDEIAGYCLNQKKFVYLSFGREGVILPKGVTPGPPPPEPIRVWDPATGAVIFLYKCPECPALFLPIRSTAELKYCPQCNKATLEFETVGYYD